MAKYRYAFNENGDVVDAMDLVRIDGVVEGTYRCMGCNREMVPKVKGDKRIKHFAHKSSEDACGKESYLHYLAKQTFFDVYTKCLETGESFWVELDGVKRCDKFLDLLGKSCFLGREKKAYDLIEYYNRIAMEKRDGQFVPDVLLYNKHHPERKLYIEIFVHHMLSEAKANSSNRIIEINIESEDDIQCIQDKRITQKHATFSKFPRKFGTTDDQCRCLTSQYWALFAYESGKVYADYLTLMEIDAMLAKRSLVYFKVMRDEHVLSRDSEWMIKQKLKMQAIYEGLNLKDCNLCVHRISSAFAHDGSPAYCVEFERGVKTYEAIGCSSYHPTKIEPFDTNPS